MKSVFITGVAGFIGRYIAAHFVKSGASVAGVDIVPPDRVPKGIHYAAMQLPSPEFVSFLKATQPDICIHCAGRASVPDSMRDPASDFRQNTMLTFEVLDALRQYVPNCRFILLSSAAVYGNPKTLPVAESQHIAPLSPYGFHKRQCELLCQEFSRIYSVPTLAVRIFSAYGPGLQRQVVWDICERLLKTGALSLKGTGYESRDFIHAIDIARGIALLADAAPAEGELFNLASGRETTIAEIAVLLTRALGLNATAAFDGENRPGDPLNWRADMTKLSAFGFTNTITLENGMREVAAWARSQIQNS
jgi:UDP-glucose 4-epimerase